VQEKFPLRAQGEPLRSCTLLAPHCAERWGSTCARRARGGRPPATAMLFYSYFKTLVGKEVTVELKNDLAITGTLHSVDQYLNVKLNNVKVVNEAKYPHMVRRLEMLHVCEQN